MTNFQSNTEEHGMQRINPKGLAVPAGFSHVVCASSNRIAFIAGQVSYDSDGKIVGVGDMETQTRQVFRNLQIALASVGAGFGDVAKTNYFVRDMSAESIAAIRKVRAEFFASDAVPSSTMVGVVALAKPDLLLEVEAYAVIP